MMQNNTKKKIAPVIITILVLLYAGPLVVMLAAAAIELAGSGAGEISVFLLLYAAVGGAVVTGILLALAQRLREIDGKEEEDAKKY
ncbi:MAG: hypothetical protein K2O18_01595 [Oscillospiraceae bacterium]|nr:hypothetical protein [Oscillospiraceae bacterium]